MVTAPANRALVRWMVTRGLSERRCLGPVGMNASALRYEPRADRNAALREPIVALALRHRRYGVGVTYLKLGWVERTVNYKRVERVYRLEGGGCISSVGGVSVWSRPRGIRCCVRPLRTRCGRWTACSIGSPRDRR